jgi:flagellar hook protein FlgE
MMSVLGLFSTSVLGMEAQSHAMDVIAANIANVRTGGYKRTDVHFATVMSETLSSQPGDGPAPAGAAQADLGGPITQDYARISQPGSIEATGQALDAAITGGRGFFTVRSDLAGSGELLFTRDGRFATALAPDTSAEGYLVDKNGYYLQGWTFDPSGAYGNDPSSLTALRVDRAAFSGVAAPTASATLSLNLPAAAAAGELETYAIDVIDSAGGQRTLTTRFFKDPVANVWNFDIAGGSPGDSVAIVPPGDFAFVTGAAMQTLFDPATGTVQVQRTGGGVVSGAFHGLGTGDSFMVSGTSSNDGVYTVRSVASDGGSLLVDPSTPLAAAETAVSPTSFAASGILGQPLTFNADGSLAGTGQYTVSVSHAGGTASGFTLDLGGCTQFASSQPAFRYSQDGYPASDLSSVHIDDQGQVVGVFDSGLTQNLYRLALAYFTNPDGLTARNGNLFAESPSSGDVSVTVAGEDGVGRLLPASHEMSNVDLAAEFTDMIQTQSVYNAAATSFRTVDEMLEEATRLMA